MEKFYMYTPEDKSFSCVVKSKLLLTWANSASIAESSNRENSKLVSTTILSSTFKYKQMT